MKKLLIPVGIGMLTLAVGAMFLMPDGVFAVDYRTTDLVKASSQAWYDLSHTAIVPTNKATVCAWVDIDNVPVVNTMIIAALGGASEDFVFHYDGNLYLDVEGSRVTYTWANENPDTWYHLCARYDGALASDQRVEMYINGVSVYTASAASTVTSSGSAEFAIGTMDITRNEGDSHRYFDGQIADVRWWTRALSDSEISAIYGDFCNTGLNGASLGGWWKFDGNGEDSSGNGNHLSALNAPPLITDTPFVCAGGSPTPSTSLLTEGQTNPTQIPDETPEFSAVYNDPDISDVATHYQIQVSTSSAFTTTVWDSAKTTLASSTPEGTRIADIAYAGTVPTALTTYYWRIKFWDTGGLEGNWNTSSATFTVTSETEAGDQSTDLVKDSSQAWYDSSHTGLAPTTKATTCAWVNIDDVPVVNTMIIVGLGGTVDDFVFHYDGNLYLDVDGARSTYVWSGESRETWYHLCVRYDGTLASGSRVEFYINGASVQTGSNGDASISSSGTAEFAIGTLDTTRNEGNSHRYFDGQIDDVRMWTRALSDSEITNIYNAPCNASLNGASLGGWWKFDGNGQDISGNANNLTALNSPAYSSNIICACAAALDAPTALLTEGQTNPTGITDPLPEFSAIYQDHVASNTAAHYRLQVSATSTFASFVWDSSKKALSSTTPAGTRTPNISYNGPTLATSTSYFWRIKFWDQTGAENIWSTTTATFAMGTSLGGVQNIAYQYDAMGNITSITDTSGTLAKKTISFVYDPLYRLTFASTTYASSTGFKHSFAYDAIGNITGMATTSATTTFAYAETNYANPQAVTSVGAGTYAYDNNGNLTSAGSDTYTWDYKNRLTGTTITGSAATYSYDHAMERVKKVVGGVTTTYPNDLYSKTSTGTTTRNIYANGELIATVEGSGTATSTYFAHNDHLGSTNVITNASSTAIQTLDYYPYGGERIDSGTDKADREFIGESFDEQSKLSYLNARYMNPATGKFVSQDAMFLMLPTSLLKDPQQMNAYSYARDNPIILKDPEGKNPIGAILAGLFMPSVAHAPSTEAEAMQYGNVQATVDAINVGSLFLGGGVTRVTQSGLAAAGKTPQILINAASGARREAETFAELTSANPGADILKQVYLRNADGSIARDTAGSARRIDFAVVENGNVTQRLEVTSLTANKVLQEAKERAIISSGGTFIRSTDGSLVNFANTTGGVTTPAQIVRRPRRRRKAKRQTKKPILREDSILEDYHMAVNHYRSGFIPSLTEWEIGERLYGHFVFLKFFRDNALFSRKFPLRAPEDIETIGKLYVKDLTKEGLKLFLMSYYKYLAALDRHTDPVKATKTILERDLRKLREEKSSK